jgi:hypothetical protein
LFDQLSRQPAPKPQSRRWVTCVGIFDTLAAKVPIAHAKDVVRSHDASEKHANIEASDARSFRSVGAIELPAPGWEC